MHIIIIQYVPSPSKANVRAQECPEIGDQPPGQPRFPFNQLPFQHGRQGAVQLSPQRHHNLSPRIRHNSPPNVHKNQDPFQGQQRQHNQQNQQNQYNQQNQFNDNQEQNNNFINRNQSNQYNQNNHNPNNDIEANNSNQFSNKQQVNPDDVFYNGLRNDPPTRYRPSAQQQPVQKDPDIWDPVPARQQQPQAKKKQSNKVQAPVQKPTGNNPFKPLEKAPNKGQRDYKKPWQANAQSDKSPQNGQAQQSKFLFHHYPDGGVGPDTELINMLERDVLDLNPNVKFEDIAELDQAKDVLQEAILLPILMPTFFTGIRRPLKGALLFGPPGTGKTMLAKAVATIGKTTFFNVSASSLASKWKGEAEKLVRILFEMARFYSPSTIFFDEIDALGSRRGDGEHESSRKVKTEMLVQMDGVASSASSQKPEERKTVMVLAATNRPWDLDEALIRRLERRICIPSSLGLDIPLPSETGRKVLFDLNLATIKVDENIDWPVLIKRSEGYSGADISCVCREAALLPMRRKLKEEGGFKKLAQMEQDIALLQDQFDIPLVQQDFIEAIKNVNKSVSNEYLKEYDKWMKEFGNE